MKKIFVIPTVVLLSAVLLLTGCLERVEGSGEIETRKFGVGEFTRVVIGSAFDFEIIRSDSFDVSITADDNLFEHIRVTEERGTLKIRMVSKIGLFSFFSIGRSTKSVSVRMPKLEGVDISGSSRGTVSGFGAVDKLDIGVSGSSELTLPDMNAGETDIDVSGASKLSLGGKSEGLDISGSGSSDIMMNSVETAKADISLSGASRINGAIEIAGDLGLKLSGSSDANLSGSAGDVTIEASGASVAGLSGMTVDNADVTLTGSSDARLKTDGRLDIDLSGASSLHYTGEPTLGEIRLSGSSDIKNENQ